jgi:hypothetical protein
VVQPLVRIVEGQLPAARAPERVGYEFREPAAGDKQELREALKEAGIKDLTLWSLVIRQDPGQVSSVGGMARSVLAQEIKHRLVEAPAHLEGHCMRSALDHRQFRTRDPAGQHL